MLEQGAQMTEWDMHETCPGYIEAEGGRTANKVLIMFLIVLGMDQLLAGCMKMLFQVVIMVMVVMVVMVVSVRQSLLAIVGIINSILIVKR